MCYCFDWIRGALCVCVRCLISMALWLWCTVVYFLGMTAPLRQPHHLVSAAAATGKLRGGAHQPSLEAASDAASSKSTGTLAASPSTLTSSHDIGKCFTMGVRCVKLGPCRFWTRKRVWDSQSKWVIKIDKCVKKTGCTYLSIRITNRK